MRDLQGYRARLGTRRARQIGLVEAGARQQGQCGQRGDGIGHRGVNDRAVQVFQPPIGVTAVLIAGRHRAGDERRHFEGGAEAAQDPVRVARVA